METTTRQFIMSMIIFGALITGCFTLISLSLPSTDTSYSYTNTTLAQFEIIKANADTITNTIQQTPPSSGPLGILNDLQELVVSGLKSVWDSLTTLTTIVTNLGPAIGIPLPSWFGAMIISLVGVVVAFSLAAAYFKWWL